MGEIDGVLHDVNLVVQGRKDVDRRIGDQQRARIRRHSHDERMADAAGGPQTLRGGYHGAHQFIGVQAALHQRLDFAGAGQRDGLLGGGVAVLGGHQPVGREIDASGFRHRADLGLGSRPAPA